jgi:hypothetical protein
MFNKYYGRSISNVSRDNTSVETSSKDPSWFNDFVSNLEKSSVQSKKELSTFEQINQIIGNKSKYSTVEEAVLDMQKRTGLYEYLRTKSANDIEMPELFNTIPELKTYIDNFVKDRPGVSVDAVVHDILRYPPIKEKLPNSDDVPSNIKEYINKQILESKKSHLHQGEDLNIGKMDLSTDENTAKDNDPFGGCTPSADGK